MKFLAPILMLLATTQAFAATRSVPLNEVPEVITKNLGNSCSAKALSQNTTVLDVKSKTVDAVYAIPCVQDGSTFTSAVYVMTANGKYDYVSFDRSMGINTYYIPSPVLSLNGEEVTISFSAPTSQCVKNESASYTLVDASNIFMWNFKAVRQNHSCNN